MATPQPSSSPPPPSTQGVHHNVVPSEVGWQFVPQYYTFVNKSPNRLHMFYTKNSTFIHGTEGEDGRPCYGQQEIHNKILSIGFQDCKVYIHSVDAQSSAAGGIIIQVIGEMSNHGEPWRKFAQTFFLAEQPNGYFVLNDIFRFLKEDSAGEDAEEEGEEESGAQGVQGGTSAPTGAADAGYFETPAPRRTPTPPPVVAPEPVRAPTPEPEPVAAPAPPPVVEEAPKVNGHVDPPQPVVAPAPAPVTPAKEPTPEPEPEPVVKEPTPAPSPAPAPPAPVEEPKPATPAPAPVEPPKPVEPPQPPKPKTWATLAASAAAKDVKPIPVAPRVLSRPPAPSAPSSTPAKPAAPEVGGAGTRTPAEGEHPAYTAAMSLTSGQCFVKGVTEGVSTSLLREILTSRFGPIKELDVVRSKACAFLEFTNPESARRAVVVCLPVSQGGEGGIRVEGAGEGGGSQRVSVEARKERGERPPSRPHSGATRGGGPGVNGGAGGEGGGGRGSGFRGRGGVGGGSVRGRGK